MFVYLILIFQILPLLPFAIEISAFHRFGVNRFFFGGGAYTFSGSLLRCGLKCLHEETCRSVGFHKIRKECHLYSFVLYSDFCNVTDSGFVNFINADHQVNYEIILKTGDVVDADSDSYIYMIINGTLGSSEWFELDLPKNDFERAANDSYTIHMRDYGLINNIIVKNDYYGDSPDWFLEKVTIKKRLSSEEVRLRTANCTSNGYIVKLPTYEIYHYNYNDWIATDRGDGSLVKKLAHDQRTFA